MLPLTSAARSASDLVRSNFMSRFCSRRKPRWRATSAGRNVTVGPAYETSTSSNASAGCRASSKHKAIRSNVLRRISTLLPETARSSHVYLLAIAALELSQKPALLQLANQSRIDQSRRIQIAKPGILRLQQPLHVLHSLDGWIRFKLEFLDDLVVSFLGGSGIGKSQLCRNRLDHLRSVARRE